MRYLIEQRLLQNQRFATQPSSNVGMDFVFRNPGLAMEKQIAGTGPMNLGAQQVSACTLKKYLHFYIVGFHDRKIRCKVDF